MPKYGEDERRLPRRVPRLLASLRDVSNLTGEEFCKGVVQIWKWEVCPIWLHDWMGKVIFCSIF